MEVSWSKNGIGDDQKAYASLKGLVNKNNGLFKSEAQAAAVFGRGAGFSNHVWNDGSEGSTEAVFERNFGVKLDFTNIKIFFVGGHLVFPVRDQYVDVARQLYGGGRPFSWFFVLDQHGVVKLFKLKYVQGRDKSGNPIRGSFGPDAKATVLEWERPAGLELPAWDLIAKKKAVEQARAEEHAAAGDAPEGRQRVSGEVLSVKEYESDFGVSFKAVVKLESGAKVFGSVPSGHDWDRGTKVAFTATFERSADDVKFGFYKRPTKAEVIA